MSNINKITIFLVLAILIVFFVPKNIFAAITKVQETQGGVVTDPGNDTTITLDFGSNITAGNLVVILATRWKFETVTTGLVATITGESNPIRIQQSDNPGNANSAGVYIFYLCNAVGGSKVVRLE